MTASAELAFDDLAERLLIRPDVDSGTGFGSRPGLRIAGKIFAILLADGLVLKLPATRCDELVKEGLAERWDRGKGAPLREWVAVSLGALDRWPELADEALVFVGG
jgi:hypothetical protein